MTQNEREDIEKEITSSLKENYPDIRTHVDEVNKKGIIRISFFWNRISKDNWADAKNFTCNINDYPAVLETDILLYFDSK